MQTMIVISMILVALYVGATIYHTKKMPESVSAMVYAFPFKWLWTIWLWLVTFMIVPSLIETLGETVKFIGFLTIASLGFCGAMPLFDKENNLLHYIFGFSAGILSQVCVALISPWWLTLWFSYVLLTAGIWRWTEGKGVFFMECICYLSLVGALINGF